MRVRKPEVTVQDFVDFFVPFGTTVNVVNATTKEVIDHFDFTPEFKAKNVVYHGNYIVVSIIPKGRGLMTIEVKKPKNFVEKA